MLRAPKALSFSSHDKCIWERLNFSYLGFHSGHSCVLKPYYVLKLFVYNRKRWFWFIRHLLHFVLNLSAISHYSIQPFSGFLIRSQPFCSHLVQLVQLWLQRITGLFHPHNLRTEVPFIQKVSGLHTSPCLHKDELKIAVRSRKAKGAFANSRKRAPGTKNL